MPRLTLDHGVTVLTYDPPPADFDISTASDDELKKYGFPSGLTDPEQQARYDKLKQQFKGRFHYIQPTFEVSATKFHGPRKASVSGGAETSGNWSGGVLHAAAGQSFKWVQGDWVVPNVGAPTQNKWYYAASWIGLDGDGSPDVCQAGVECEVYRSGTSVTRNIYPWIEWFPLGEAKISNFAVVPGDMVTMIICTAGPGSTSASILFGNHTSGASMTLTLMAPSGTKLVGNCAEWIVEAPTVGGQQSAIADFGEVFFSPCQATLTAGTTTISGGTGNTINLVAGTTTEATGAILTPLVIVSTYTGPNPV